MHSSLRIESRHSNFGSEPVERYHFVCVIVQKNFAHRLESFLISGAVARARIVKAFPPGRDTIATSEVDASDHLHLETRLYELGEVVLAVATDAIEEYLAGANPGLFLGEVEGVAIAQVGNGEEELAHEIVVAARAVVQYLTVDGHGVGVIAQLPLRHLHSCEFRVAGVVDNLTLVYQEVLVVSAFCQPKEGTRAAEDVHDSHVGQPRTHRVEFDYSDISLWHHLAPYYDLSSLLALLVEQRLYASLFPTAEDLTN